MKYIVKSRRQAREVVLQALYAYKLTHDDPDKILNDQRKDKKFENELDDFVCKLLKKTIEKLKWSKAEIVRRLQNWEYDRVALVDRLILQMMITEMVFMDDIPPKVSIAEGVEIAKKYSTAESGAFVNGILDSVYHSLENLTAPTH